MAYTFFRFDGLTIMHRFKVEKGKVVYRNCYQARDVEKCVIETGEKPISFGQDPCKGVFHNFFNVS
jgi:hypothetical protein